METPALVFRNLRPSHALRVEIFTRLLKLQKLLGGRSRGNLIRCTVTLETPHRHNRKGRIRHVRMRLTLPRGQVVVAREPAADGAHEDIHVALRDAFQSARRQIEKKGTYRLLRGRAARAGSLSVSKAS